MTPTQRESFKPLTNQYGKVVSEVMKAKKITVNAEVKIIVRRS